MEKKSINTCFFFGLVDNPVHFSQTFPSAQTNFLLKFIFAFRFKMTLVL